MPATPIRIALAVVVLITAILIMRGFSLKRTPKKSTTVGVGAAAGVLTGSMGIVGPPVILFYFSSPIGIAAGRASIITYFIGTDAVGAAIFASQGLIDLSLFWRFTLFLPIIFVGTYIGKNKFATTDPQMFKKLSLVVLMFLSALLIVRAVFGD